MSLQPNVRSKVTELFLNWLTAPHHQDMLKETLQLILQGENADTILMKPPPPTPVLYYQPHQSANTQRSTQGSNGSSATPLLHPASPRPSTPPNMPHVDKHSRSSVSGAQHGISPRSPRKPVSAHVQGDGSLINSTGRMNGDKSSLSGTGRSAAVGDRGVGPAVSPRGVDSSPQRSSKTASEEDRTAESVSMPQPLSSSSPSKEHDDASRVLPTNSKSVDVPSFFFPGFGKKAPLLAEEVETQIRRISHELFKGVLANADDKSPSQIPKSALPALMQVLNVPLYWKAIVFAAAASEDNAKSISKEAVLALWKKVLSSCPDEASRFVYVMTRGQRQHLVHADFQPLLQDILATHPGLAFLESAKDFHSRYVTTVTARIFFCVNSSWSGRISLAELRRSDFLAVLASLELEDDINMVTQYFSYEHFYVIYCKFWELDDDHDLIISKQELAKHNSYAISSRMIDRIFSGAVFHVDKSAGKRGEVMTYSDFVWFLLAEEDKRHSRSIEYWFRCMDVDGDGAISMYEMEYFYKEQLAKMDELNIDPIPFEDCLCQMLDMVNPREPNVIRLSDLKRCKLCHIFFDTFFNYVKYIEHEQRDPFSNPKNGEDGINEISDWDRYASEAYEALVAEDGGQNADDIYESDFEGEDSGGDSGVTNIGTAGANPGGSSVMDALDLEFPSLRTPGNTSGGGNSSNPAAGLR